MIIVECHCNIVPLHITSIGIIYIYISSCDTDSIYQGANCRASSARLASGTFGSQDRASCCVKWLAQKILMLNLRDGDGEREGEREREIDSATTVLFAGKNMTRREDTETAFCPPWQ